MTTTSSKRVVVHGNVQGVFFRDSTSKQAEAHGVSGWVRNRPDGTVEARFEGESDAVGEMIRFCREGPPQAEVGRVEVDDADHEGFETFEIHD